MQQNHYLNVRRGARCGVRLLDEVKPEPPKKPEWDPSQSITGEPLMRGYRKYS